MKRAVKKKTKCEAIAVENDDVELLPVTLKLKNFIADPNCEVLAVVGSDKAFGEWQVSRGPKARNVKRLDWIIKTKLPMDSEVSWKWVVINKKTDQIIRYEMTGERSLVLHDQGLVVSCSWGGDEKIRTLEDYRILKSMRPAEGTGVNLKMDEDDDSSTTSGGSKYKRKKRRPFGVGYLSSDNELTADAHNAADIHEPIEVLIQADTRQEFQCQVDNRTTHTAECVPPKQENHCGWFRKALKIAVPVGIVVGAAVAYAVYTEKISLPKCSMPSFSMPQVFAMKK